MPSLFETDVRLKSDTDGQTFETLLIYLHFHETFEFLHEIFVFSD